VGGKLAVVGEQVVEGVVGHPVSLEVVPMTTPPGRTT